MEDLTVKLISSSYVPTTGTDLRIHNVHLVVITVGRFGPYNKYFEGENDTPQKINEWKMQKQNDIRMIAEG